MGKKRVVEQVEDEQAEQAEQVQEEYGNQKNKEKVARKINPHQDLLQSMKPNIQFLIQHRNVESEEKQVRAAQVYKQIEGILFQIAQTKIGGRTIQLIIKCSSPDVRKKIFEKLLSDKQFPELLKAQYGHYIGVTMVRNMVSNYKQQLFDILYKHAAFYAGHYEASVVLNRFLLKVASPNQINMMKKLFQTHDEKIDNLAMKVIEKGIHTHILGLQILKVALPKLVPQEREKVLEYFQVLPNFDYLEYNDGVAVFCAIVNYSDKKARKVILKNITTYMEETQQHLNKKSSFSLALIKLLHSLDDTKVSNKAILSHIVPNWIDNPHNYSVIASIFIPKYNPLIKIESIECPNEFSLKDPTVRLTELANYIYPTIIQQLQERENIITDSNLSRFTAGFIKFIVQENKEDGLEFVNGVMSKLLKVAAKESFDQNQESYWVLTQPDAQRLAKSILLLESSDEPYQSALQTYHTKLYAVLSKNLQLALKSKAIYLLVSLIEHSQLAEKVIMDLKKQDLSKVPQSGGLQLLKEKL